MGRCSGCAGEIANSTCACSVSGSDTILVSGTGSGVDPFVLAAIVDPSASNRLEGTAAGLYVPDDGPLGLLDYDSITAESSGSSGADVQILALAAQTPGTATRRWKVTAYLPSWIGSIVGDRPMALLKDNGSAVQRAVGTKIVTANAAQDGSTLVFYVDNPSAVAHTYTLAIRRVSGTGIVAVDAAATYPAFLALEDVGSTV